MKRTKFPAGWDAEKVQRVLTHYEGQTEDEAQAEDEAFVDFLLNYRCHNSDLTIELVISQG